MTTSGVSSFKITGSDLITDAMMAAGVLSPGESYSAGEYDAVLRTLNMMVKVWSSGPNPLARGLKMWARKRATLFLQDGQGEYDLGPSGDHASASVIKTTLTANAAVSATSLTVASITGIANNSDTNGIMTASTPDGSAALTLNGALVADGIATMPSQRRVTIYSTGDESSITFEITGEDINGDAVTESVTGPDTTMVMSSEEYYKVTSITISGACTGSVQIGCVGDFVGVELNNGTIHWDNINGTPSALTIALIDGLAAAAASGNRVFIYTTKMQRPLSIVSMLIRDSDGNDQALGEMDLGEYENIGNKEEEGTPSRFYFENQLNNAKLYFDTLPDDTSKTIEMVYHRPLDDMIATDDALDFPQEWHEALKYNLAVRIATEYGLPVSQDLYTLSQLALNQANSFYPEVSTLYFEPDRPY